METTDTPNPASESANVALSGVDASAVAGDTAALVGMEAAADPKPEPTSTGDGFLHGLHDEVDAIERLALFWGGEIGTKMRNHAVRLRDMLPARPARPEPQEG